MPSQSADSTSFDDACEQLEAILGSAIRSDVVGVVSKSTSFVKALEKLRDAMRTGCLPVGGASIPVTQLDARTRRDGFHALHDWDGNRDEINEDMIPVDVLDFLLDKEVAVGSERRVLAILLDYYLGYLLALLTLRVWDQGDPNDNLDRLSGLLRELQGENGSGQHFAASAEMLMLVAVSHYESDESAYDRLLDKIKTLDRRHRETFALILAGIVGSHLRFGFEATYGRDIVTMRNDNGPDYPWLSFALATLMEAYVEPRADGAVRERIVEGLANGLSPDPRAFVGVTPECLQSCHQELASFRERFERHHRDLLADLELHRPSTERYSPIAFYFNFLHNTLKAVVVDALLRGEPSTVPLDDLLTAYPASASPEASEALARTLMSYARSSPDKIRGKWVPVIVYDPRKGRRAFSDMMKRLS